MSKIVYANAAIELHENVMTIVRRQLWSRAEKIALERNVVDERGKVQVKDVDVAMAWEQIKDAFSSVSKQENTC